MTQQLVVGEVQTTTTWRAVLTPDAWKLWQALLLNRAVELTLADLAQLARLSKFKMQRAAIELEQYGLLRIVEDGD